MGLSEKVGERMDHFFFESFREVGHQIADEFTAVLMEEVIGAFQ